MEKIRILLVDDLARVREGLRTVLELEDDLEVVGEAADGLEAVQQAEKLSPDVVLMDLEMPRCDGFEATRQIRQRHLAKGVVVLTIHGDHHSRERATSVGVNGFVEKGTATEELIQAIHQACDQNPQMQLDGRLIENNRGDTEKRVLNAGGAPWRRCCWC